MNPAETSPSRSGLLVLAGILIAVLIGFGVYELAAARAEWAKLADLTRQHETSERRLQQLEQTVKLGIAQTAPAKPKADPAPPPSGGDARAKLLASRAAAQAYGNAFLNKYPQARAMLIEFQTRNMENYYAPFFRAAGLTQAQIDDFIARTAAAHLDSLQLRPNGDWSNGQPNLSPDEIQSLVGAAAYQQWQDSARAIPAQNWVGGLASAVKSGAPALTADQAIALTQIVAANSPEYVAGNRVNPASVDVNSVMQQAKSLMTDAQWQQAQSYLTLQTANQQLQALMKGAQ